MLFIAVERLEYSAYIAVQRVELIGKERLPKQVANKLENIWLNTLAQTPSIWGSKVGRQFNFAPRLSEEFWSFPSVYSTKR